ncbi:hypothetical protein FNYG_10605 [Fusarium nygamai]|uniref:MalT-like TPR region domain-containing protein n=1 Tax=Gibberella nygamai TaxID=42673 RepID=A0A2K0W196_GIBNY|nr:hypothetical protein FNYG_10605 [Fusarium nygamai]
MLLELISQIGPSSIPKPILARTGIKGGQAELEECISTLCSFFLLAPRQKGNVFDMPTIVHLCLRIWAQKNKDSKGLTETVTKHLNELVPQVDWSKQSIWKKYQSHAIHVLTECQDRNLKFDERFQLACRVGSWLLRVGQSARAVPWLQQALAWAEKSPFKYTKRRLRVQLDLAEAYAVTDESTEAIQLTEKALKFQEKQLAKDDSSFLAVSCTLAKCQCLNGQPKKEIDRLEKLMKVESKRSVIDKFTLLVELGRCYNYAEEHQKAAECLEIGIDEAAGKFAKDDPILLLPRNNLAYAFGQKGHHRKAISLLKETLPLLTQVLGGSHDKTLKAQSYLVDQYLKINEPMKAISLLEELVPIQRKTLGPVNIETMCSEDDLAEAYFNNQNVYTALKLYEHMRLVRQNLGQSNGHRKLAEAGYQKCAETWKWTWMRR